MDVKLMIVGLIAGVICVTCFALQEQERLAALPPTIKPIGETADKLACHIQTPEDRRTASIQADAQGDLYAYRCILLYDNPTLSASAAQTFRVEKGGKRWTILATGGHSYHYYNPNAGRWLITPLIQNVILGSEPNHPERANLGI